MSLIEKWKKNWNFVKYDKKWEIVQEIASPIIEVEQDLRKSVDEEIKTRKAQLEDHIKNSHKGIRNKRPRVRCHTCGWWEGTIMQLEELRKAIFGEEAS